MGYDDLVRALEAEVDREIRATRAAAEAEAHEIVEAARRRLTEERGEALARAERELAERAAGTLARARLEAAQELLREMRRHLDELRAEAARRLPTLSADPAVHERLLAEVIPELIAELESEGTDGGPLELRVEAAHLARLRRWLEDRHPELARRVALVAADLGGGVAAALGGRRFLDDTLPGRLERAWTALEPDVARALFGDADAGV